MLMAWDASSTLVQRFAAAYDATRALWPSRKRVGGTYQGYVKALIKYSPRLLRELEARLRHAVEQALGAQWRMGPWVVLGVDGSRFDLPRTAANERAFGCAARDKTGPQAWVTTILHLASGLPWCWKIGRGASSERDHLRQMIHRLPTHTLLVADAGYCGYDLWRQLLDHGHDILIRVGANVRLLRQLGCHVREHEGIVYLWPSKAQRRNQRPLILRLIRLSDGRRTMHLVTSVLDDKLLSETRALECYRMRWGLELWYRALKQTLDRRTMRSGAPVQAALELRWALLSMSLLGLMGARSLIEAGVCPRRLSFARCAAELRRTVTRLWHRRPAGTPLTRRLRAAVIDDYRRKVAKHARAWPHVKREKPPGPPRITIASPAQIQHAQYLAERKLSA